jgi:hypothetical protein
LADETTSTETLTAETVIPNDAAAAPAATALGDASTDGTAAEPTQTETGEAAQTDEQGAKEGEEAAQTVPEAYELQFSDGFVGDPATLEAATPVLKELGLSNDQAQALVPLLETHTSRVLEAAQQAQAEMINAERSNWLTNAKADAEIGGEKWDTTIVAAAKGLDGLGFPKGSPLRDLLDASGLGNHPEMIRAWSRVGEKISEDSSFPRGGGVQTGARTNAEILYPSSK